MSKSKMFGSDEPRDDDDSTIPSPKTTIVGGRPPEEDVAALPVPTGIQSLLRLASVDRAFRQHLVERRLEAAAAAGVELTASEQAILTAIPGGQLEQMSATLPEPPTGRREFLQRTAAAAVVLLGGAAVSACDSCLGGSSIEESPLRPDHVPSPPGGARPDLPDEPLPRPDIREMAETGGAAPDEPPPPRPEHREMETDGGAAPDEPPLRPEHREMETEGGAAPDEPPVRPDRPLKTRGISHDRPKRKKR